MVAGRFALCDPLDRGATGTVWRAWDLRRQEWCAAKLMRQRDAGDPLRFAREQGVRLEHPHLLTPYSWAAEDAHVVIVSPLIGGGSLHTLLGDHGPLSEALVADLLDQLLDGLAHAHAAGLVHRDVTPANVLLEATGSGRPVLRLADFGLAVRVGEPRLTRLGTVLGTAGYVPPEVLAGAAPHPSADLYAAGQVALTLLTGTEPDTDGTRPIGDATRVVGDGTRPTGDGTSPTGDGTGPDAAGAALAAVLGAGPLRDLVVALVAPDPADRPASAAAARRADSPPGRSPPRPPPPATRSPSSPSSPTFRRAGPPTAPPARCHRPSTRPGSRPAPCRPTPAPGSPPASTPCSPPNPPAR